MRNKSHSCAISSCTNPKDKTYFSFPREEERKKIWVSSCARADFVNVNTAKICEIHFSEDNFVRDFQHELMGLPVRRRLNEWAVPNINLPYQQPQSQSDIQSELRERKEKEREEQRQYIASLDLSAGGVGAGDTPTISDRGRVEESNKEQGTQCTIEQGFYQARYFLFKRSIFKMLTWSPIKYV